MDGQAGTCPVGTFDDLMDPHPDIARCPYSAEATLTA